MGSLDQQQPRKHEPRASAWGRDWFARGCAAAVLAAGCASAAPPPPVAAAADQERMVLDLRAKNAGYVRHIEELENRIFILEDQLDSRALASEQRAPATLPGAHVLRATSGSVAKVPAAGANRRATAPASASAPPAAGAASPSGASVLRPAAVKEEAPTAVQTSIVAEHAVDYAGDAAQAPALGGPTLPMSRRSPRPWLRISGSSGGGARERSSSNAAAAAARPNAAAVAPEPLADSRLMVPARSTPDPLRVYRDALETLRAGHPDLALAGFRRFLEANPSHDYADNAAYWIGECHYDQRQFRAAERSFRGVVERYPHGNKVPDAMLKLGFTLQWLGDEPGGRAVLESLARAFPKHEAARMASERLAHPEPAPPRGSQSALGTILPLPTAPGGGGRR
ncbi:MAG: tol-pal system protein YbgF [Polyangia bacterium]